MIVDATDASLLGEFLRLPDEVYRGDEHYRPPPDESVLAELRRDESAGRRRILLARDNSRTVARLEARVSDLSDPSGRPYGMLGSFEALDRADAVGELFATAVAWLREQGAGDVIGPIDGDTWRRYRLNVGPFDHAPFLMEPYNPPYYPRLWEQSGFQPLERYYSKRVPDAGPVAAALQGTLRRATSRGYRFRSFDLDRFEAEMELLYSLATESFAENFLYREISSEEFLSVYRPLRPLLEPGLITFAMSAAGEPAGFVFAVPNHDPKRRRRPDAVNIKTLGVSPTHRRQGLAAALMCRAYQGALEQGIHQVNLCLIRDGNPSGEMDAGQGIVSRRYVLYVSG